MLYYIWFSEASDKSPKMVEVAYSHKDAQKWVRGQGVMRVFYQITVKPKAPKPTIKPMY